MANDTAQEKKVYLIYLGLKYQLLNQICFELKYNNCSSSKQLAVLSSLPQSLLFHIPEQKYSVVPFCRSALKRTCLAPDQVTNRELS